MNRLRRAMLSLAVAAAAFDRVAPAFPETSTTVPTGPGDHDADASVEQIAFTVEHATIRSHGSFASVRTAFEASLPRDDGEIPALLRDGRIDQARLAMDSAPALSIFGSRDHGALLRASGQTRNAVQYDVGNYRTASRMALHRSSAALYAPIRVLLREGEDGVVAFEVDRPVSTFGQFHDPQIDDVARDLDRSLMDVLIRAAG